MPKYLGLKKTQRKRYVARVTTNKKRKNTSSLSQGGTSNADATQGSASPQLVVDPESDSPNDNVGIGLLDVELEDDANLWSRQQLFFQSYLSTNGVATIHRDIDEVVFIVIGMAGNCAVSPIGVCTLKKVDGQLMSFCTVDGCHGSDWAYMDMATRGIGKLCSCAEGLIHVFPRVLEVEIPFKRTITMVSDGLGMDEVEDIVHDVTSRASGKSTIDEAHLEQWRTMAGIAFEFELEENGTIFKAVCCGLKENAHAWGLTRQYGTRGQEICLTCKRHTSSCVHAKCARRCCSDILMDSNAFEANDPDVDVGANEVDHFAKLEDIFKKRQLGNFFYSTQLEVAIGMHQITEAVSRIMVASIRNPREQAALNMDDCFGEVMDTATCPRCQTSCFEPINDCVIVSQHGIMKLQGARVCPTCACDPRASGLFFVPKGSARPPTTYHQYVYLVRDLMLCWNSFSETKHSFISLLTTLVRQGQYSSPPTDISTRQLIKASRDSFRQAMRGLIASIDIDKHSPFQCACEDNKSCKRIHIDGLVLGVKRRAARFEQPWLRCRHPALVKPFLQNYLHKKARDLLWKLATCGLEHRDVLELRLQCPWQLQVLLLEECLVEDKSHVWHLAKDLRELGMAVGSHYPLNSLIPFDCRMILEEICGMESMCEATDPLVARIFSSSRFLGIALQFLMKISGKEVLFPFFKYLLARVQRSTVEERVVETGEGSSHSTYLESFEGISSLHLMTKVGAMGPKKRWIRSARQYGRDSAVESEKDHARSFHFTPGLVYYLCGGCENVVGFHVINEKNAESTIEIVEYMYAFFEHAPEEVVYDNGKELELASSLREPSFFARTRYYQDQMHHRNHTTAPEHYNSKHNKSINGPLSEQFNASVRCRQNSMMFSSQVGYVTLICAQALYWNAKKRQRLKQP